MRRVGHKILFALRLEFIDMETYTNDASTSTKHKGNVSAQIREYIQIGRETKKYMDVIHDPEQAKKVQENVLRIVSEQGTTKFIETLDDDQLKALHAVAGFELKARTRLFQSVLRR